MKAYRDNIYEVLSTLDSAVARQWRLSYYPPVAHASRAEEIKALMDYFFRAFSRLPGDNTHVLNCLIANANNWEYWLHDFTHVVAVQFVSNARHIFAPTRDLADNVSELGQLLGAY
jgi:hypothetical protein